MHDLAFRGGSVDIFTLDVVGRVFGTVYYGLFRLAADGTPDLSFAPKVVINTGNIYQTSSVVTPEGSYTPAKIGKTEGAARFVGRAVRLNIVSGDGCICPPANADVQNLAQSPSLIYRSLQGAIVRKPET